MKNDDTRLAPEEKQQKSPGLKGLNLSLQCWYFEQQLFSRMLRTEFDTGSGLSRASLHDFDIFAC